MRTTTTTAIALLGLMLVLGCAERTSGGGSGDAPAAAHTECTDPRPEVCAQDYRPVCATRDTGVRCVTEPCPATEQKTYSNACSACSDPEVTHWVPGECPEPSGS